MGAGITRLDVAFLVKPLLEDVLIVQLLGQSFLRRFKSWSIDNQKEALVLN